MSREDEHPGLILASVLKEKSIDPLALAEGTQIPYSSILRILEGKQDIGQMDSVRIENYIGGDQPEQWSGHKGIHNGWKKRQP